jgi:hypothetical protein
MQQANAGISNRRLVSVAWRGIDGRKMERGGRFFNGIV